MDKKPRRPGWMERATEWMDLPGDALAGLPRIELVGDRELRMENHKGILAYGSQEIQVSGGVFIVQVTGQELELRAMNGVELLITGIIEQIRLT